MQFFSSVFCFVRLPSLAPFDASFVPLGASAALSSNFNICVSASRACVVRPFFVFIARRISVVRNKTSLIEGRRSASSVSISEIKAETSGSTYDGKGAKFPRNILRDISDRLRPWKGNSKQHISYRSTPRDHTSALSVYCCEPSNSGDKYAGVPQNVCMYISSSAFAFDTPRSHIFAT